MGINDFKLDPNIFPQILREVLALPLGWNETKWTQQDILLRNSDGELSSMSIHELISAATGGSMTFAGLEFINSQNGRQLFFGLNPESKPGNLFAGPLYHERAGGGSTLAVVAQKPDDTWVIAFLDQERPSMGSGTRKRLQSPGGYSIEMAGTPDEIHRATSVSEGRSEISGKLQITTENLMNLYAPYNTNNGMVATAEGQGIATQLLIVSFDTLIENGDGTYSMSRELAEVTEARLERIFGERFHPLTPELRKELHQPSDGCAACTKTYTAADRANMYLIEGI